MFYTCLLKTHSEYKNECARKDNGTAASSSEFKETNICDKTENLSNSVSSEISLNLKFSDTEESTELNSSKCEKDLESAKEINSKSESTEEWNKIKNNVTPIKETEVKNATWTRNKNNETEKENGKSIVDKSVSESNYGLNVAEVRNAISTKNENNKREMENDKSIADKSVLESKFELNLAETNNNIVFSVAKITLSDDDNIYTDSDTASGMSCYGTEINKKVSIETSANSNLEIKKNVQNIEIDNFLNYLNNQNDSNDNQAKHLSNCSEDRNCDCKNDLLSKDTNYKCSLADLTTIECDNDAMNENVYQHLKSPISDIQNKSNHFDTSPKTIALNDTEIVNEEDKKSNDVAVSGL